MYGDFRRLPVADFPDHQNIRILADDRAEAFFEGEPCFFIHLDLRHALDPVLHGILDRDDIHRRVIQEPERRIERRRLSRTGRPGRENHPCFPSKALHEKLFLDIHHPEMVILYEIYLPGENADDDRLAVEGGQRGNAEIIGNAVHGFRIRPVLRQPALGDVHAPDDLGAHGYRLLHRKHHREAVVQNPVPPETHADERLLRLDMHITYALADRRGKDPPQSRLRRRRTHFFHKNLRIRITRKPKGRKIYNQGTALGNQAYS